MVLQTKGEYSYADTQADICVELRELWIPIRDLNKLPRAHDNFS